MSTPLYTPVNFQVFNERYEEAQQRRGGAFKKFSLRKGGIGKPYRNVFRVMPPHPNMEGDPIIGSLVHFGLGPGLNVFSPCLVWWSEECPACIWNAELSARARRESDPNKARQYKEVAWKQRSQDNHVCQVVDMSHPEQGVMPFFFSDAVEKLLRACFYSDDPVPVGRDITDPTNGRDIIADVSTKPGPDEYPNYDLVKAKDTPSPLFDAKFIEQIADLTEHIFKPTREEVAQALQGQKIDRRGGRVSITAGTPPAAQGVLPAPPVATPTPIGSAPVPGVPPPPVAPVPGPSAPIPETPQAAPAVTGRGRGGRPGRVAAGAVSGPIETTATVVTPPIQRVAVTDAPALPYAAARTRLQALGVPFHEITREKVAQKEAAGVATSVPCYKKGTDPADKVCQDCIMILPCLSATAQLPE